MQSRDAMCLHFEYYAREPGIECTQPYPLDRGTQHYRNSIYEKCIRHYLFIMLRGASVIFGRAWRQHNYARNSSLRPPKTETSDLTSNVNAKV